jgi:integrase
MALTDTQIRKLKPKEKEFKASDEKGLYLVITPKGNLLWKQKIYFEGKEQKLSHGPYPEVTLKAAREKRDQARSDAANGIDPAYKKKAKKLSKQLGSENNFAAIATEWHLKFSSKWTPDHGKRILERLKKDIFPWVGKRPIAEITPQELFHVLCRIESRGAVETAHRALQNCGQIFKYAVQTCRVTQDITSSLRGALQPVKQKHHASITEPKAIGALLRALDSYQGHIVTKCALRIAPLVFVRPGELRQAEWSEICFNTNEWHIPTEKMKMREKHIVPLSQQAITILQELIPLTGDGKYVFPSIRTSTRPMSNNTVLGALRRIGYTSDEMTGHGFRSMACTLLNEQGWNRDAIECQLAHAERNKVRASYNYAKYLPERRKMMQ